jgi:hypothetical protein
VAFKFYISRHLAFSTLILTFICLNLVTASDVLLDGRFWAEEGTIYWANSYQNAQAGNRLSHLVFLAPPAGYHTLTANLITFLGVLLGGIYFAPLITAWLSLLLMLLPSTVVYLYFTHKDRFSRIFLSTLVLFSPAALAGEIFANSINSQVFLGLTCALFLFTNTISQRLRVPYYIILILSALSTMYVYVLIPFYLIHYFLKQRNRVYLNGFFVLFFCLIIQLTYVFFYPFDSTFYKRSGIFTLEMFFETFSLSAINFFGGNLSVLRFVELFQNPLTYTLLSVLIMVVFFFYKRNSKSNYFLWMAIALFFCFCFFIAYGAVNQVGYGRYGYIPSTLFGLILFFKFEHLISARKIQFSIGLVTLFTCSYLFNYIHLVEFISRPKFCSTWATQVDTSTTARGSDFLFWPCYENPIWKVSSDNIRPSLMDFQKKIIAEQ